MQEAEQKKQEGEQGYISYRRVFKTNLTYWVLGLVLVTRRAV
jgi:hypothetical protein